MERVHLTSPAAVSHCLRGTVLVAVLVAVVASGCQTGTTVPAEGQSLRGTLTISGAWALYPMMVRWGEEFGRLHPEVQFDISAGGAGKGMTDALAGAVDIGMVSREVTPEEEQRGAFWVPVTKDAVFATVNASNPVLADLMRQGVSRDEFAGIYVTGQITTWGEIVGHPEITDPIHVYTRSDAAGAPETWAKYLGKRQEDLGGVGVYGDPGVMEAIVKDKLGIGYNNLGYAFDLTTGQPVAGVRVIPVDGNGNGQADAEEVLQTLEQARAAVANGAYPSPPARDENLVTRGKPEGLAREFILWIVTEGQSYVDAAGYVALPKATLGQALDKLK